MSWFRKEEYSWLQQFACNVVRSGPVPKHIGFIMDGNRRFARKSNLGSVLDGHAQGFDRLSKVLQWCRDLGITEVTVYAFSIENFKRSSAEVDGLMNLAHEKFAELLENRDKLAENQVRFRFLGHLEKLPMKIQKQIAEIEFISRDYDKACLNVCLAYTAQDEITRATKTLLTAVEEGHLEPEDINEDLVSRLMDTGDSRDPDFLLRTSGEQRFSDFLLWQCSYSCLYFDRVLWPEFSFWNLCYGILQYQRNYPLIEKYKRERWRKEPPNNSDDAKIAKFLDIVRQRKTDHMKLLMNSSI